MTAHKKTFLPAMTLIFATAACQDKGPPPADPVAPAAVPAPAAPAPAGEPSKEQAAAVVAPAQAIPSPYDVCQSLVGAAKSKDDSKLLALSTPATATALAAPGAKEHIINTLAAASCGAGKAENDSATVALDGTTPPQEAGFTKGAEGWKFDGAAFLAKYPVKAAADKAKKAANKANAAINHKGHKKHK